MSESTATATQEMEKEIRDLAKVESEIAESKAEHAKLQSEAQALVTTIMADIANRPNWTEEIKAAAVPATNIQARIERLEKELVNLKAASRWESSQAIRQPVLDTIKTLLIDNPPTVSLESVSGSITIEDGKAVVTLRPKFSDLDVESLGALVASEINVKAFTAAELTSLDIRVSDIGGENKIAITPKGEGLRSSGGSGAPRGPRAKSREYMVNGNWVDARALLQFAVDSKDEEAMKRIKGFMSAINSGNGAFDLAVSTAERLKIESREKAPKA